MISVPDMLRLRQHLLHKPCSLYGIGETRVILDVGCNCKLSTGLHSRNQNRRDICTRRIYRCGVAGRTGADD